MELGVGVWPTDLAAEIVDVARMVEQAGLGLCLSSSTRMCPPVDVTFPMTSLTRRAFWTRSPSWALQPRLPRA
jgi:hypothetical protein